MAKEIFEHKDKLGRVLAIGDCVVYPDGNTLDIGTIKKFSPKMIRVQEVPTGKWKGREKSKYPNDMVKVEGPEVTMFLIKSTGG